MNFPKLVSNQFVRAAGAVLLSVLGFGISSPQCVAQPAAPVATPVPAPRSPEAEKAIRDYYAQISVPSYRQETDFAIAKLAPDYTETGQDGKLVHRAEAVQAMLAGETYFVNPMQCQFVIRSFKWHGEHAVVEEEDENKTTVVTGGQNHAWDELEMIREVWSLVHGQWMLRSTVILQSRDTVDGQVVPAS